MAYLEQTWENQQERFAKILLTNLFAIFEGWLEDIKTTLNISDVLVKALAKTTRYANGIAEDGVFRSIQQIQSNTSSALTNAFYTHLTTNSKYSLGHLDNLLKCYKFFKESRNCVIHNGGRVDTRVMDAYNSFQSVASISDLGVNEVPIHIVPSLGAPVEFNLRGVVGFGDVLIRIMVTIDAELSTTESAETELISRCREWATQNPGNRTFRDRQLSLERRARSLLSSCEFPRAANVNGIQTLLRSQGII